MKITIALIYLDDVCKKLDRLVKKANKHDIEFSYRVVGESYYKTVSIYNVCFNIKSNRADYQYKVEVVDLELSNTLICANGWTVSAHLEHMEGGHNLVTPINYIGTIPAHWYNIDGNCEHCNSNRNRSKTYMVERNGEYKQVGSSCLKDYTGISPELVIAYAQVQETIINDNMDGESLVSMFGGTIPSAYKVVEVVALSIDSIKEFGYCKADNPYPTKDRVLKMLQNDTKTESQTQAEIICNYAINYTGDDEIINNAKAVILSEYCKYKHFGRLVYLPLAIERDIQRKAKEQARAIEAQKSNYIGNIGERITIKLTDSKLITSFETMYGTTFVYRFTDENGNVMTWFASKNIDISEAKNIKGTIKDHNEYNGEKQTILTRCKVS